MSLEDGKRVLKTFGVQAPAVMIKRWSGRVRGDEEGELRWRVEYEVGEVAGATCVAV